MKFHFVIFIFFLLTGILQAFPVSGQQSCMDAFFAEHPNLLCTDTSYSVAEHDEFVKTVIARQEMAMHRNYPGLSASPKLASQPCFLAIDTVNGRAQILAQDGTYLADVHIALVDSTWYMWLSVDPLADKNITGSPYMYCNGNPIMLVDPDGRDDYLIDVDGNIQLFCKTNDNFDRLGTQINGEFDETNYVKLNDKSLISGFLCSNPRQDGTNYVVGKNGREVAKFFLFAAKNSEVEWSMSGYIENDYRRYGFSTSHNTEKVSAAYSSLGVDERRLLFTIHSHGREDGTQGASTYDPNRPVPNDMSAIYDMYKRFIGYYQNLPAHYVYHTHSNSLYNYTPFNSSIFIRTISSYNSGLNFLIPAR